MSGHGGDGFLKFQASVCWAFAALRVRVLTASFHLYLQDFEEISSQDIADSIQEMYVKKRYNEIFFMVDTCQAGSLSNAISSPKVVTIGSSQTGENSYAHHSDQEVRHPLCACATVCSSCAFGGDSQSLIALTQLGLSVIDRFTFSTLDYLQQMKVGNSIRNGTLRDLFNFYNPRMLFSTPAYRDDILGRSIDTVPITDFFSSVLDIRLQSDEEAYPIEGVPRSTEGRQTVSPREQIRVEKRFDSTSSGVIGKAPRRGSFQFSNEFLISCAMFVAAAFLVTFKSL